MTRLLHPAALAAATAAPFALLLLGRHLSKETLA